MQESDLDIIVSDTKLAVPRLEKEIYTRSTNKIMRPMVSS